MRAELNPRRVAPGGSAELVVDVGEATLSVAASGGTVDLPVRDRVALDTEKLSQTFIKYKGAQSGTLDWRPVETLPEDYYAL